MNSFEAKLDATWRLCLPIRNQFTLAFMRPIIGDSEEDNEIEGQVCERLIEVHLPTLAKITIGELFSVKLMKRNYFLKC